MLRKPLPFLLAALLAPPLLAQGSTPEAEIFFKSNCTACHTIGGGRLVGPDLKDVTLRQDRAWLAKFIVDPAGVIASGDDYAQKILQEAKMVPMVPAAGITPAMAELLLDLIEAESRLERSQFRGAATQVLLTDAMIEQGRRLFLGQVPLSGGGPSCLGCHSVATVPYFGGGRLGPDLTEAYARLNGQAALTGWLGAPPSLVMTPVFRDHPLSDDEINQLVAFLREVGKETGRTSAASFGFVATGTLFGVAVLFLLNLAWRNRFRAVRKPMLENSKR
ncbi:MAG: c-type cytochrome [Planctomycetes bacterium]|nr:c-type cytochrome [Planctomycetota bacterium]MBL7007392.1 c-type cytochrome [Planctomycetota bacterium]